MLLAMKRISLALAVMAGSTSMSLAQSPAPGGNQATADAVAGALKASRSLAGTRIEIETRDGMVTLKGRVANQALKAEALGRAQQVAGVKGVIDQIALPRDARIQPAQYQPQQRVALGGHRFSHAPAGGDEIVYDGAAPAGPTTVAGPGAPVDASGPLPEGPAIGGAGAPAPGAPNYAWPSYAPYPNFSAVGYPTAYPWQAWPNIGPPYPYPEVPLDWRAVTLRWDDGIWWLDFKKHYTRPFFTPYPFGIFSY
ncbi:BON domain-containing protein [Singulisphaera sp. PoT]|uniref:BON domain-containing protein n=1 Tax=Singulisphaera sp. PoT TaxID=3411797 RepID=UPI003BF5B46B